MSGKDVLGDEIEKRVADPEEALLDVSSLLVDTLVPARHDTLRETDAISDDFVEPRPFEVYLRYEDDVASAYRDFYRDQVVNDKRNELGRFLFGVSFTTLSVVISVLSFSKPEFDFRSSQGGLLLSAGLLIVFSALCSLRLAIPKNQDVDPTTLELVRLHRENSVELSRLSFFWFILWLVGFLIAGYVLIV